MITFTATPTITRDGLKKLPDLFSKIESRYLGEAYIKLHEDGVFCTMTTFSSFEKKQKAKEETNTTTLEDELVASNLQYSYEFESDVHTRLDKNYWVEKFLEKREYIFFEYGWDIWRMMKLFYKGDIPIRQKLRTLMVCGDYMPTIFFKIPILESARMKMVIGMWSMA